MYAKLSKSAFGKEGFDIDYQTWLRAMIAEHDYIEARLMLAIQYSHKSLKDVFSLCLDWCDRADTRDSGMADLVAPELLYTFVFRVSRHQVSVQEDWFDVVPSRLQSQLAMQTALKMLVDNGMLSHSFYHRWYTTKFLAVIQACEDKSLVAWFESNVPNPEPATRLIPSLLAHMGCPDKPTL